MNDCTYERAIHALARQNHDLHRQVRALKAEIERLQQMQIAELQERSRMVEEVHRVNCN